MAMPRIKLTGYQRAQVAVRAVVSTASVARWEAGSIHLRETTRIRIELALIELGLVQLHRAA